MIKNIFLLGSTGSIGVSVLKVVRKNKKNFRIKLLTTNGNINKIFKQAVEFNVKTIVVHSKTMYSSDKNKFHKKGIKVFFDIKEALNNLNCKSFLTISAISGIEGLEPTLDTIKYSKNN